MCLFTAIETIPKTDGIWRDKILYNKHTLRGPAWTGRDWIVKDSILEVTVAQDPAGPRIWWHIKIDYKMHLKRRAKKILLG